MILATTAIRSFGGVSKERAAQVVRALLEKGADVNIKGKLGYTALMWAADKGATEIVQALIDKGADINLSNEEGRTALMLASDDAIKKLIQNVEKKK